MTYRSIVVTRRGGPEVLQVVAHELRDRARGEARIRVRAVPVCQDDIAARVGNRPFLPKVPFVPGYAVIGVVDAVGEGATEVAPGDRVTALIRLGGYAEYTYLPANALAHVPETLNPAEAAPLILNYLVAWQVLHRLVRVKSGGAALVIGASGGVGTAFLQLGRLAGLKMYGTASPAKHDAVIEMGARPVDYRSRDLVGVMRQAEPQGLDYVFNGMGEEYLSRGVAMLRRGGTLAGYGAPQGRWNMLLLAAGWLWYSVLPNGKSVKLYGTHRESIESFREDWAKLFALLEEGRIRPVIAGTFPLLQAAEANALLESGGVTGNVVLVSP